MASDPIHQLLDDAVRICAVPAPTFAEGPRAELVAGRLTELGGAPEIDEAGNVLCRFGPAAGEAAVFAAHLDTVFGPDQPIEIRRDEAAGRIHGPGIGDNSLGVAGLLGLARRFAARPPSRPLVLAATVGEEGLGDLRGAKHLLATLPCRAFIALEGAMLDSIRTAGIGSVRYRARVTGPGGHSWGDRGTASAVHGLVQAATRLLAEPAPAGLARNIGRIGGGTSINTIAAAAELELDLRAADPEVLAQAAARARALLEEPADGLEIVVETIGERPSGAIPDAHPLLGAARQARARAGLPPAQEGPSSTDANAAYGRGIPAITIGLTTGAHAHRLDEYIDTGPLAGGWAALEQLALALGNPG
jgi:tripeptide aminopeptidase